MISPYTTFDNSSQHLRCVGHAPSPDSRLMYDLADVIATRARGRYG